MRLLEELVRVGEGEQGKILEVEPVQTRDRLLVPSLPTNSTSVVVSHTSHI